MSRSIYIDGNWIKPRGRKQKDVINPAPGAVVQSVDYGGKREAGLAVEAKRPTAKVVTPRKRTISAPLYL